MGGALAHHGGDHAIAAAFSNVGALAPAVRSRDSHPAVVLQCKRLEKQNPAKQGSDGCDEKMTESYKKDSCEDDDSNQQEKGSKGNVRRGVSRNRRMQTERDAARTCRDNRNGRQTHGALCNLTSVSM